MDLRDNTETALRVLALSGNEAALDELLRRKDVEKEKAVTKQRYESFLQVCQVFVGHAVCVTTALNVRGRRLSTVRSREEADSGGERANGDESFVREERQGHGIGLDADVHEHGEDDCVWGLVPEGSQVFLLLPLAFGVKSPGVSIGSLKQDFDSTQKARKREREKL